MTDQQIIETLATEIMGWVDVVGAWNTGDNIINYREWNPLQNIAHAFILVEKMVDKGFSMTLNHASEKSIGVMQGYAEVGDFHCNFTKSGLGYRHYAKTAQEAICQAALKVVGVDIHANL